MWTPPNTDLVEVSTTAADARYFGVGASPYIGDLGGNALQCLTQDTQNPGERQLFRLCAYTVPNGKSCRIVNVTQYSQIGQAYPQEGGSTFDAVLPITSIDYSLPDGNIAWMIRVTRPAPLRRIVDPTGLPLRSSPNLYALTPALVYVPAAGGGYGARYRPPSGGIPPGHGVGILDLWKDNRYPPQQHGQNFAFNVNGPAIITYWCSVWQPDPAARGTVVLPDGYDKSGLGPEQRFFLTNQRCIYTRVAGAMVLEQYPTNPATMFPREVFAKGW